MLDAGQTSLCPLFPTFLRPPPPPLSEVSDRPPAINGSRLLQLTDNNDPGRNIQPGCHRQRLQSVVQLASALEKGGEVGFEEGLSMQACLEPHQTWEEACWDRKDRRDRMDRREVCTCGTEVGCVQTSQMAAG